MPLSLFAKLVLLAAGSVALPKSASIVDVPPTSPSSAWQSGNVRVVFTDGHAEKWTKLGQCMQPHVSSTGLVGWVRFTNEDGYRVANTLRVCRLDGHYQDLEADMPFIERWDFQDEGNAVVIKSRGNHGPASYIKYDLKTGVVMGQAGDGKRGADLPTWAQPFSD